MKIASSIPIAAMLAISLPAAAHPHKHYPQYTEGRVVGGTDATPHSAQWQAEIYSTATYSAQDLREDKALVHAHSDDAAYLAQRGSFDYHHICGGILIAPNWVLTAAHCTNDRPDGTGLAYFIHNRRIRLGTQNLKDGSGSTYAIKQIVINPHWNDARSANDIALIEITPAATLDPANIAPIRLLGSNPGDPTDFTGQIFTATGWGVTEKRGANDAELLDDKGHVVHDSALLQTVVLNYVPRATCAATPANRGMVTASIICAGVWGGGKDTCQGDSGGPLTYDTSNGDVGETVLVGIVSSGTGCAQPKTPALYTYVPPYLGWIAGVMASK